MVEKNNFCGVIELSSGLTAPIIYKALGFSRQRWWDIKTGRVHFPYESLPHLSKVTKIPFNKLLALHAKIYLKA